MSHRSDPEKPAEAPDAASVSWLPALRRYLLLLAIGNLVWEFAQMPLYTLWFEGTNRQILLYGLHCLAGDILIGLSALTAALFILGSPRWPRESYGRVAGATIALGIAYTLFSEWYNVQINESWAYASTMPQLFGIGLAPIAQWIIVPALVFWWAGRRAARG